jgi:acetyl esterase
VPLDPQVKTILDQLEAVGGPALHEMSVDDARQMIKMLALMDGTPEPATVTDRTIPGPRGDIAVRVYRPDGVGDGALPVLVWYHGGGWVIGDLDTADPTCRKLANRSGALVVSVGYALAPEERFPAAVDDCWAALHWVSANAGDIGGDPTRIAVGGDSAGGNLAAIVAWRAAREGGPALRHQLLVYPVTDLTLSHPSIDENGEGYLLTKDGMVWFVGHYLGPTGEPKDPLASPLYADDLSGAAPATVLTAEFDPLRDEGEAYADRLSAAGVPTEMVRFDGMIHGFFALGAAVDAAGDAVDLAGRVLNGALA